jgi:hypothetical protein
MTRQFRTFIVIFFSTAALLGVGKVIHLFALRMMPYVDRCEMPCQWNRDAGFVSCQPLRATLEIKTTPEPSGRGEAVWFRATTTNQSCRTIHLDDGFYAPNREKYGQMDDLILTDERDQRVPTSYRGGSPGVLNTEKEIHPYAENNKNVMPLIRTKKTYQGEELTFVYLDPGQTVATGSSELAPYRMKYVDVETKNYLGTAAIPEPVLVKNPEKIYAVPPPGFRRLNGYDLRQPGRYKARFVIQEETLVDRFEDPRAPFENRLRRIVYQLATGWAGDRGTSVKINVTSAPVEFEIKK